ncbi:hypothetical protein BBO99_00008999 [Phytophthora kernoviae]|uniref:protein-serine/threonine phosphatase n=2 Tax=Phytophthora kernoviae TaxID=325452 RepID=A0A3R7J2S0_9STRA|nr:hypothetical protein G195_010559 [Phytophthora kernoviae 00238/432]KAG2508035.1 hypothetical protein JM16_008909 [Phytophthora kernoviae]KAG2510607.1 hypothetical protein JM18_008943 [Phytophthora kernoviae]RLN26232.1 hypothetical protein BBI17_008987 [Phytophthora kernoviae]RLN74299.1 hypothetical protein BBO99_00008999 [Phytophthora kernoviae]
MGCQTSKDVLPASPQRPSLSHIYLQAASKQQARDDSGVGAGRPPASDSHRDVFSIFAERGMMLEASGVVVKGSTAIVSSVGDSQVVLSTAGRATDMCIAHTPELSSERDRILAAKGQISKGRIYGMLGVSRAFGDNDFKTARGEFKSRFNGDLVSATPDVVTHEISSQDEFMVLGCDGLFDVMVPQDVVNFVRAKLGLHGDVQHATEELVSHAIALGSTDNVSAIIVCLNQDEQEVLPVTPIEAAQAAEAKKRAAASVEVV